MVFVGMGIHAVSNFLLIFSPSWTFFCCMYFLVGLGNTFSYSSTFVLGIFLLVFSARLAQVSNFSALSRRHFHPVFDL